MRTRPALPMVSVSLVLLTGCQPLVSLGGGQGGAGEGGASAMTATSGNGGGAAQQSSSVVSSSASGPCMQNDPNVDGDGDGFTPAQGDCDDCDPTVNPNAVDTPTFPGDTPKDDDCDGIIDNAPQYCDTGLAVDDADPLNGARAVDLCKLSAGPNDWGVVSAQWVLPDGTQPPAIPEYALGHGMLSAFGPNVSVKAGQRMLGLSSGTARQPMDPGYQDVNGFVKGYTHNPPMGFPKESPSCPGIVTGQPNDGAALEVTIRTPSNATGFNFDFNLYTLEWPDFICTTFNDVFVSMLWPIPAGQMDGNISFDSQGNTTSVNSVFLEVCGCQNGPPCMAGGKTFTCGLGTQALTGTGFDGQFTTHGATGWLATAAPVKPNSTIVIRWGVYDSGDGILDTTTLVDNWQWLTSGTPVVITYRPK